MNDYFLNIDSAGDKASAADDAFDRWARKVDIFMIVDSDVLEQLIWEAYEKDDKRVTKDIDSAWEREIENRKKDY